MAGYSGKPLHAKLGVKPGQTITLISQDNIQNYMQLLGPDRPEVEIADELKPGAEMIHVFMASRSDLADFLPMAMAAMTRNGMIWVSWPKKASKRPSDITEDTVRALALPLGLVDVKVCAVDETYSGLKLVIRKELR